MTILALQFALAFLGARIGSLLLYRSTWNHGLTMAAEGRSAIGAYLLRPWPWLVHLFALWAGLQLSAESLPATRPYAWVCAGSLALGAVGRWGAVDRGRFWVADRIAIVGLFLATYAHPAFLYPLVVASCSLQYTVARWPLQPGYSNLLGFEFLRGSAVALLSGMFLGLPDTGILALVLCHQAAGYVAQAMAKSALGRHPFEWILENRLECLVVNAWLRGWRGLGRSRVSILRWRRWIAGTRVGWCAAAWIVETGWIAVLSGSKLALGLLAATSLFHLAVWVITGLAGVHYLASHAAMAVLIFEHDLPPDLLGASVACVAGSVLWTLLVRREVFRSYRRNGSPGRWNLLIDPVDHLMAWWDSPAMRLYTYSVTTSSGRRCHFPVRLFSPYDTFMTDLHTHLMILGKDWPADPYLEEERGISRRGVWGLVLGREESEGMLAGLPPRAVETDGRSGSIPRELEAFFVGLNRYRHHAWFRILWKWPHFPGEDLVPDWSPLSEPLPAWTPGDPIVEVQCHCVQSFQRPDEIERIDERVFCRFPVESP